MITRLIFEFTPVRELFYQDGDDSGAAAMIGAGDQLQLKKSVVDDHPTQFCEPCHCNILPVVSSNLLSLRFYEYFLPSW